MIAWAVAALLGWCLLFACIWAACASRRVHETEASVRLLMKQRDEAYRQVRLHSEAANFFCGVAGELWTEREAR